MLTTTDAPLTGLLDSAVVLPGEPGLGRRSLRLQPPDRPAPAAVAFAVDERLAREAPGAGAYANFVEEPGDASTFFDARTSARLRAITSRYDASDLFAGNHHIPPAR